MRLSISHRTLYVYGNEVTENINEVRLLPRPFSRQEVLHEELRVTPAAVLFDSIDYWGNRVHHFGVMHPHMELEIESRIQVETHADAPGELAEPHQLRDFLLPTRLTAPPAGLGALGRDVEAMHRKAGTLPEFLAGLAVFLHRTLEYRPGITTVESTVAEVLGAGGGVCQDFAHVFIALCRQAKIPARYAGGYLYHGSDGLKHENHAWAEAYVPDIGWTGWDPANGSPVSDRHVQVTAGRDYDDVSPIRGRYRGSASGTLHVYLHMETL